MNTVSLNGAPLDGAALDLLDFPGPPVLTRQRTLDRDELLPGFAAFAPIEPVVNGESFVVRADRLEYDITDVLNGEVPEEVLIEMGLEGYITEHEDSDDEYDDELPPAAA